MPRIDIFPLWLPQ